MHDRLFPRTGALGAARILQACVRPADGIRLAMAASCAAGMSVFAALAPVALKLLLETLEPGQTTNNHDASPTAAPALALAAYIGALLLARLAGEGRSLLFGAAEQSVSRSLSRSAFVHVIALPMSFHVGRSTGAVVQTLENGLQGYRLLLQHALFTLLPGLIEIGLIAALLVHFFDPVFLFVFSVCAGAYAIVFVHGARRVLGASRAVSAARIAANAQLADGLLNFETVKAFCGEAAISQRYDDRLADTQRRWRRFYLARMTNGLLIAFVFAVGLGATLWLALGRVEAGMMTLGDLVLVNAWMLQVIRPLELLGFGLRDMGQGAAYVERLSRLLREPPEQAGPYERPVPPLPAIPASIRFETVSFSYAPGQKVLDRISFDIAPGTTTALVGPSGSGKSSIIRLLMRFHVPDEGRILIDGDPITCLSTEALRSMIALIPQDTILFNESLAFNIGFPKADTDPADIDWAAGQACLDALVQGWPEGFGTQVGERGLKLSGGERQRVAIARACLRRARIMLADEATSALDSGTEALIGASRVLAAQGATCLLVAHRLATIAHADQILVLENGRIVERGQHEDLCKAGGYYAEAWKIQSRSQATR